ncbi:hypothetical protein F0U63_28550 [Cystobacter fuscus]|nr:hypothetical protein F0U63_28550 [Cystobacter fuscus]
MRPGGRAGPRRGNPGTRPAGGPGGGGRCWGRPTVDEDTHGALGRGHCTASRAMACALLHAFSPA